jgi:hypothetical protein
MAPLADRILNSRLGLWFGVGQILSWGNMKILEAAHATLAQCEERISVLLAEREAKLLDSGTDWLSAIAAIDHELATLRASVVLHGERIAAMEQKQRSLDHVRRLQERAAAIAAIKKTLPARLAAAQRVDAAVKQLVDCIADLDAADEAIFGAKKWPAAVGVPVHQFWHLKSQHIGPLSLRRIHRMQSGLFREIASKFPFSIADAVAEKNNELIAELESASVPDLIETTEVENAA